MVGIVNKPDINYGIWASNGDVAVPSSEKVEIGHIVEKPKKEIVIGLRIVKINSCFILMK